MILLQNTVVATPSNFKRAEDALLEQCNAHSVLWSGRAATSLYHAYRIAALRRPDVEQAEVIVPTMMCATAANVAYISGIKPRFADVELQTGLITLERLKARFTPNTIAVVAIHLLGQSVDIEPIANWCIENNLLLIEDPTQALGGRYADGRYLGSVGDVTVYSFGSTKIIQTGNGALVANTQDAAEQLQAILDDEPTPLPNVDDNTRLQLALSYRNLHHALVGLLRLNNLPVATVSHSFIALRSAYEALYLRPVQPEIDLNRAWDNLPESLERRLELARIYAERLQGGAWHLLTGYEQSGVCWRFSMLLDNPEKQVAFSEAVRRDGFHVSNLYWAVNQFFDASDDCPNADSFGRRIVNLWVDASVDADYVRRCCDSLLKHSDEML
jgi:dTDP-4-amino-4,6-dideoxygalactose transaminase